MSSKYLQELDEARNLLDMRISSYEEISDYEAKYEKLTEFSVSIPQDPTETSLADLNPVIENVQSKRDELIQILIQAINNRQKWENLAKDVGDVYKEYLSHWLSDEEVRKLRSYQLQESEAQRHMKDIMSTMHKVEAQFRLQGHGATGEAVAYEKSVERVVSQLDSTNASINKMLTVIEHMITIGEIRRIEPGEPLPPRGPRLENNKLESSVELTLGGKKVARESKSFV